MEPNQWWGTFVKKALNCQALETNETQNGRKEQQTNVNAKESTIKDIMKCLLFKQKIFCGESLLLKCIFNEFPFLYIFAASLVTLILRGGGALKKKESHIKTFSQNATTLGEDGYWFIPEALIRKTGSQHKVFPLLYSNEAEFAL